MKALCMAFAAGALAGCGFVAALMLLDVGGLGSLVARDGRGVQPLFMLLFGFGGLFGLAVAISSLALQERPSDRPLQPVRVAAAAVGRPRSPSMSGCHPRRRA